MEFKTLTEKKAREFNLNLEDIETEELELEFNKEKEVETETKNEKDFNKFDYKKYTTIISKNELDNWKRK